MRVMLISAALAVAAIGAPLTAEALAKHYDLHIPRQPLDSALKDFAQQTGLQIARLIEKETPDEPVGPISGDLSAADALEALLASTRLTYRVVNERTIAIVDAPTQGDGTPAFPVEEIVVTAQKRIERLQDVPVPVTALNANTLASASQVRLQDYYLQVPGLAVILGADNGAPRLAMRGLSTGGATNPTVAIVIDDIPFGPSTTAGNGQVAPDIDPSDLARVEALRGPQGTLYGASSLGGLLKFITVGPSTDRFGGSLQAGTTSIEGGDGLGYNFRGALNVPLSGTLAVRVSAFDRHEAGYIDNVQTGDKDINGRETYGGRLSALWAPTETLSLNLSALYQNASTDGTSEVHRLPGLGDLEQSSLRGSGRDERTIQTYSATLTAKFGGLELTSLTGYSIYDFTSNFDGSPATSGIANTAFGVAGVLSTVGPLQTTKFSQELRVAADLGERIDWMLGVFYTEEDVDLPQQVWAVNPATGAFAGQLWDSQSQATFEDYAVFGNITLQLNDQLDVQVGARANQNRLTSGPGMSVGPWNTLLFRTPAPTVIIPYVTQDDDSLTYLVTPRYRLSPEVMVYARFASGYRPGGVNSAAVGLPPTHADTTRSYEVGMKGDVLNDRLSFDLSVYRINWQDMQIQLRNPTTLQSYLANAGEAASEGVELSADTRPWRGFNIGGWVAWNDAELTENFPTTGAAISTAAGREGERLPYSSRFSGNLSVAQEFPLVGAISGYVGGSVSYVGERVGVFRGFSAGVPQPRQVFPSYSQIDLRVGMRAADWSLDAFINNVSDKRGVLRGGFDAPIASYPSFNYIQPRTIGVSASRAL